MDLELFSVLVGVAIGGILGRKGKDIVKPIAKGFMTVQERTREWGANLREDMRDAIEEARYEREHEAVMRDEEPAAPEPSPAPRRRRAAAPASEEAPARRTTRKPRATAAKPRAATGTGTGRRRRRAAGEQAAEGGASTGTPAS